MKVKLCCDYVHAWQAVKRSFSECLKKWLTKIKTKLGWEHVSIVYTLRCNPVSSGQSRTKKVHSAL